MCLEKILGENCSKKLRVALFCAAAVVGLYLSPVGIDVMINLANQPESKTGLKIRYHTIANLRNTATKRTFVSGVGSVSYSCSKKAAACIDEALLLRKRGKNLSAEDIFETYICADKDGDTIISDEEALDYRDAVKNNYIKSFQVCSDSHGRENALSPAPEKKQGSEKKTGERNAVTNNNVPPASQVVMPVQHEARNGYVKVVPP